MRLWGVFVKTKGGGTRQMKPSYARKNKGFMRRWKAKQAYKQAVKRYGRENVTTKKQPKPQRIIEAELILTWLSGDLDCNHNLLVKIARVARDTNTPIHINFGKRSYAEQKALYAKYGSPRAARPGTSRHETGLAADCVSKKYRWQNIGDIRGAREEMRRQGLCLPVAGESWHVEEGTVWKA